MILAQNVLFELGLSSKDSMTNYHQVINFEGSGIFFMPDTTWLIDYTQFSEIFREIKQTSIQIVTVVYDILPFTLHPSLINSSHADNFKHWFHYILNNSDALLTISKSEEAEIKNYLARNEYFNTPLVSHWPLGYKDLKKKQQEYEKHTFPFPKAPYLLMVGTVEPRKSHSLAFNSMELLWKKGFPLKLCIAGQINPEMRGFIRVVQNHPEFNKLCFFYEKPSDEHLHFLYKNARALLFLSQGEGFGLPLVEAASYGAEIICSDIPIFREIAGRFATYIKLGSAQCVAAQLEKWWKKSQVDPGPSTLGMPILTWEESTKQLIDKLIKQTEIFE